MLDAKIVRYGKDYREIMDDTIKYLQSIDPRWNNLTETDASINIIHAIAYLASLNNYYLDRALQELHPDYATEDSSRLAIAHFLGYRSSGPTQASGMIRMYLSSTDKLVNSELVIPKYYSFNVDNDRRVVHAPKEQSYDLSRLECMKIKFTSETLAKEDEHHRLPVAYLKVVTGSLQTRLVIDDPGENLKDMRNSDYYIPAYVDANPMMMIKLRIDDVLEELVVDTTGYQLAEELGEFDPTNNRMIIPYIDIRVVEGQPVSRSITSSMIVNNEVDLGLENAIASATELMDYNGYRWTHVDNILYNYDEYGLATKKYSTRYSSKGTLVIELPAQWSTELAQTTLTPLFDAVVVIQATDISTIPVYSIANPVADLDLSGTNIDATKLSEIHIRSVVISSITGASRARSTKEDLLTARIQARSTSTIITVPDLAGQIKVINPSYYSAAADLNDDSITRAYIASKIGSDHPSTYRMYYSVANKTKSALLADELNELAMKLYKLKHIFIQDLIYVEPDIRVVDLEIKVVHSTMTSNQVKSIVLASIPTIFDQANSFSTIPSNSLLASAIHSLDENFISVVVNSKKISDPHIFTLCKLGKVIVTTELSNDRDGGYRYGINT